MRIFDTRANKEAASKSLNAHADACRDAQFNPFYDHILAAIYENGSVVIWDRRMAEQVVWFLFTWCWWCTAHVMF